MAVLGQNIRTGSRHVEIDSIKRLVVVLTPRPADAVSVLPLIRYCGGRENVDPFRHNKNEFREALTLYPSERPASCPVTPLIIFYFNL